MHYVEGECNFGGRYLFKTSVFSLEMFVFTLAVQREKIKRRMHYFIKICISNASTNVIAVRRRTTLGIVAARKATKREAVAKSVFASTKGGRECVIVAGHLLTNVYSRSMRSSNRFWQRCTHSLLIKHGVTLTDERNECEGVGESRRRCRCRRDAIARVRRARRETERERHMNDCMHGCSPGEWKRRE